ncbi:hypothetical protein PAXINDRAFT_22364 [Paxillus involutus ATCC 200175]|uniref:Uncharacterized protein n=1 Tax=Paxillus involutus ATCC 200175 TaxID=664439 RepID=A0A0C9SLF8_PAXIN|nr:hypothetical protein PAXINDRAFT_22364 [Paxillus involutus ATCC 200175]
MSCSNRYYFTSETLVSNGTRVFPRKATARAPHFATTPKRLEVTNCFSTLPETSSVILSTVVISPSRAFLMHSSQKLKGSRLFSLIKSPVRYRIWLPVHLKLSVSPMQVRLPLDLKLAPMVIVTVKVVAPYI